MEVVILQREKMGSLTRAGYGKFLRDQLDLSFNAANRIGFRLNSNNNVPVQTCFSLTQVTA